MNGSNPLPPRTPPKPTEIPPNAPATPPKAPGTLPAEIRVFVSSTFQDMIAERNELGRRTFLELRKLCDERGVVFTDVDLRWGITDEQKTAGRVLPDCLDEVRRCRPFFIGLLGERYGSTPEVIPADLVRREPWLADGREHSVTELEILHGVLRHPQEARHAFFYFRDSAFLDSLPPAERSRYEESPGAEEIRRLGPEGARRASDERRRKLAALKEAIKSAGFPARRYHDAGELGLLVFEDLKAVIETLYPADSVPDRAAREEAQHQAAVERLGRDFVGRREAMARLDDHASGSEPPLVVTGPEGIGKSALLARWESTYAREHLGEPLLVHFVGASPESADWAAMLRRLLVGLGPVLGEDAPAAIPDEPDALRRLFAEALDRLGKMDGRRVVLIIDNLGGLEDRESALDLVWLPKRVPANVRMILSAAGRPFEEAARRGWPTLVLAPLTVAERLELVNAYLGQYAKALSEVHLRQIIDSPSTGSPLYTRTLLEEVRLCGDHATLGRMLADYLSAGTSVALGLKIADRFEQDYQRESERPRLVRDALSLLWAAKRGLSEHELLEMLKIGEDRLPRAYWLPLFLAIEPLLQNRAGLLTFAHDFMRRVVEEKYLVTEASRRRIHGYLAYWFKGRAMGRRKLDELPWHLARSGEWKKLAELLGESEFLQAACDEDRPAVRRYLKEIERQAGLTPADVFRAVLREPRADPRLTWEVAGLLGDLGYSDEAGRLRAEQARHFAEEDKAPNEEASMQAIDRRLQEKVRTGEFAKMNPFAEMQSDFERIRAKMYHQAALGNQAVLLIERGELAAATKLLEEQERICRETGEESWLVHNLANQGIVLEARGDLDGALARYRELEAIARRTGERLGLADALAGIGRVLRARGENAEALVLLEQEEDIRRETADVEGLRACMGRRALLLDDEGRLEEALAIQRELEAGFREADEIEALATCLQNQGSELMRLDRAREALRAYEAQEEVARRHGMQEQVASALEGRASALFVMGRADEALALFKEEETIGRVLGNPSRVVESLVRQALVLAGKPGGKEACIRALAVSGELIKRHRLTDTEARLRPLVDHIKRQLIS